MTKLTFPTIAEQVADTFRTAPKTISIATLAKRHNADVERLWDCTRYTFDDDTSIEVYGRGRAHKIETFLP